MSRRTTITAITAATLLALVPASAAAQTAPGGPGTTVPTTSPSVPPPGPPLIVAPQATTEGPVQPVEKTIPAPFANTAAMADDIRERLKGNAFGWQFAIAQNGKLAVTGAGGFSRSNVDTPGQFPRDMTPTTRYEIASLSKNITAVATMKLLRMTGQSINASVDPWLPSGWVRGPGFKQKKVTFAHLLSHTSGINQMISTLPEGTLTNNRWDAMRKIVAFGTQPGSQRSYKNANYAILRIANAFMWKKLGGNINGLPVAPTTHAAYALDFVQRFVFKPAGLTIGCAGGSASASGLSYPKDHTQSSNGQLLTTHYEECAGHRGYRMSALDIVRYLAHLRHGSISHPADLATMDALRLGWNEDSNGGDGGQYGGPADGIADNPLSPGVFWHGGDLIGTNQVHTCGMTFADGTEASMIVNSPLKGTSPCGVLLASWHAAK